MCRLMIFALLASIQFASLAYSKEIGRFFLDGREIIVNDDKTWKYVESAPSNSPSGCTNVSSKTLPINICLDGDEWDFLNNKIPNVEIGLSFKKGDLYLLIITEKLVLNYKSMKRSIIKNAQNESGLNRIKIILSKIIKINGSKIGRLKYVAKIDGVEYKVDNYYGSIKDKGSFQFVFHTDRKQFDKFSNYIDKASATIKVGS